MHGRACLLPIASLLAACTATERPAEPHEVAVEPSAAMPAEAAASAMAWPSGDTCRSSLVAAAALPEPERRRLDPATAPVSAVVVDDGVPVPSDRARDGLTLDLPIPTGDPADTPCLLLVELAPTARAAPRRPLAHEVVRSTYRRGSQRVSNPEHEALRRKLRDMDDTRDDSVIATGDPTIDLIGLVAGGLLEGIGAIWRGRAEGEAREALAATPSAFVEPVWEPYTYELTTVETERSGRLRATLIERADGTSWALDRIVHEDRRFKVAVGRVPKDRDLLEDKGGDIVTTADVAVWERGGLRPSLTWLANALPSAPAGGPPRDMAMVVATWAASSVRPPSTHDREQAEDDPIDGPAAATGRRARHGSVEQVVTASGVRRYRLVEPAAGDPPPTAQARP